MSQDYCNIDEKSILSKGDMSIPRLVPKGRIHEEDDEEDNDDDDDDMEDDIEEEDGVEDDNGGHCANKNTVKNVVVPPLQTPNSGFTMNMMDTYMKEMKTSLEKGFQAIKLQNQRDNDKGEFIFIHGTIHGIESKWNII